jgi:hypothetical protein
MPRFIDDLGKSVKAGMKAVGPSVRESVKSTVKGLSPAAAAISSLKQGAQEYSSEAAQGAVDKMIKNRAAKPKQPKPIVRLRKA